jgi:hypothetical protein
MKIAFWLRVGIVVLLGLLVALPVWAGRDLCTNPKVIKTSSIDMYRVLRKQFRGMGRSADRARLAKALQRLWRMGHGGGKKANNRSFARRIRKAIRKAKQTANKPFCFSHPRRVSLYGLMRLANRPMSRVVQHCIDHDTHRISKFVPGSFLIGYPYQQACRGTMYTELRRRIGFSLLYYPVLTPMRRFALSVNGQRVDVFVWHHADKAYARAISKDPVFRFRMLQLRKKLAKSTFTKAEKAKLLKANRGLIDKEIGVMIKKMGAIKEIMGGYLLLHPHKGKPGYFGHVQIARLNGVLQRVLNSTLGRWALKNAVRMNMDHIGRKE